MTEYDARTLAMLRDIAERCSIYKPFAGGLVLAEWNVFRLWHIGGDDASRRLGNPIILRDGNLVTMRQTNSAPPRFIPMDTNWRGKTYRLVHSELVRPRLPDEIVAMLLAPDPSHRAIGERIKDLLAATPPVSRVEL